MEEDDLLLFIFTFIFRLLGWIKRVLVLVLYSSHAQAVAEALPADVMLKLEYLSRSLFTGSHPQKLAIIACLILDLRDEPA